ncbi:hypothetical protein [Ectropis obliqua nucleopolyhedrovirus]|uniref:Ac52 n=1 Tax=Ectropis obliqua nucleopolyhedrovirus TaxID=59376 RepID=A0EYT7_9ABAC|nr:hypothetical protein EONV_gp034 [Ectropis obliqua nucleopolyhedrovirus]ABI35718.1 hypothetical protein [Ectropis obliqua nucleopolyhedrovirus]QWV59697.1 hypothetical protein EONV_gp034 [Ectropis obliqua nucleopolyhedrovirus]UYO72832.1 hypothetical protein EONV-gp034 [Ectropis obliqua nucleopolyhedrovirus]
MELIKPFLQYSKAYRDARCNTGKLDVYNKWLSTAWPIIKKLQYNFAEYVDYDTGEYNIEDKQYQKYCTNVCDESDKKKKMHEIVCDYCYAISCTRQTDIIICVKCLYPVNVAFSCQEMAEYCLLSVCFYEQNKNNDVSSCSLNIVATKHTATGETTTKLSTNSMSSIYNVWYHRLLLTWQTYNVSTFAVLSSSTVNCSNKKLTLNSLIKCPQCETKYNINLNNYSHQISFCFDINLFCNVCLFPKFVIEC